MNSLESLLERIKRNNERVEVSKNTFTSFLNDFSILPGNDKIPTYTLYYLYLKFIKANTEILPLKKNRFYSKLATHIPRKRTGKQRYYLVDLSKLKLEENDLFESRIYDHKQKVTKEKVRKRT